MAEFLIRAQASKNPAASEVGDIIIVRPDGHKWGKCECLPEYLVVKFPDIKTETVKQYEEQLTQVNELTRAVDIIKRRKFKLPLTTIQSMVTLGRSETTLDTTAAKDTLIASIVEKTV